MKRIGIALIILVVLVIAIALAYRPEKPPAETPVLPSLKAADIQKIEISRKDGVGKDAKVVEVTLEKKGAEWRVTRPVDYRANPQTAENMAEKLAGLTPVDVVAQSSALHQDFEITKDLAVSVKGYVGGEKKVDLLLGSMRNGHTFARLPDQDKVFRLRGSIRSDFTSPISNLRDKTMLKLPDDRIDRVTFTNENGTLALARGKGGWAPVGAVIKNFNYKKFESLVKSLAELSTHDFADEAVPPETSGLGDQASKVVIHVAAEPKGDAGPQGPGEEHTIFIGAEKEKGADSYVRVDQNPQIFLLAKYNVIRFKPKADDYARTDEQMKKETEAAAKAAAGDLMGQPGQDPSKQGEYILPQYRQEIENLKKAGKL